MASDELTPAERRLHALTAEECVIYEALDEYDDSCRHCGGTLAAHDLAACALEASRDLVLMLRKLADAKLLTIEAEEVSAHAIARLLTRAEWLLDQAARESA